MNVEAQTFFDEIDDFEFINKSGLLDLELFTAHLWMCFFYDFNGNTNGIPDRNLVYECLLQWMVKEFSTDGAKQYFHRQPIADWTPDNPVYPGPYRSLISMAALVMVQHNWVNNIGTVILAIPQEDNAAYYGWVKPEWVFVKKFFDSYHDAHWRFINEFESNQKAKNGYSLTEALELAKRNDESFEDAIDELKSVGAAKSDAVARIEYAIEQGFYLEAITLQECLLSNLFLSYLEAKKVKPKSNSLSNILQKFLKKQIHIKPADMTLFKSVDEWRDRRNQAIHGYISIRQTDSNKTHYDFMQSSKETALSGQILLNDAIEWYEAQAKHFLDTTSPVKAPSLAKH